MASSWLVLHSDSDAIHKCNDCRQIIESAEQCGMIQRCAVPPFTMPASLLLPPDGTGHSYVVLAVTEAAVVTSALCNPADAYSRHGGFREYDFLSWGTGWQSPSVRRVLELMILAGQAPEQVWIEWQNALGRKVKRWYVTGEWI